MCFQRPEKLQKNDSIKKIRLSALLLCGAYSLPYIYIELMVAPSLNYYST